MKQKLFVYASIALLLTGCISAKLMTPTEEDVTRVMSKYPSYNLSELNEGKALFEQNCGKCHGLKNPTSRSEEKWKLIVPRMVAKINKKKQVLDEQAQDKILKYLITMGSAPKIK